jgi:hypothetical protein
MHVGVIPVLDFPAVQTFAAAVNRHAAGPDGLLAVQRLSQGACQDFELIELMPGEQIRVRKPAAFQRTLQQLHTLLLRDKISESHRRRQSYQCRTAEQQISEPHGPA